MARLRLLIPIFVITVHAASPPPDPALDCSLRILALNVSIDRIGSFADVGRVYDALQLAPCGIPRPPAPAPRAPTPLLQSELAIWVSSIRGRDTHDGASPATPLATLPMAQSAARALRRSHPMRRITVHLEGRFHLRVPLELRDSDDSYTTWRAWPGGAKAIVSGGVPLSDLSWAPSTRYPAPVLEATLPTGVLPSTFEALFDGDTGVRLPLAREPNGNVETDLQPKGWALVDGNPNGSFPFPSPGFGTHVEVDSPARNCSVFPVFGRDFDPR